MSGILQAFIYISFLVQPRTEAIDLTFAYRISFESDLHSLIAHSTLSEEYSVSPISAQTTNEAGDWNFVVVDSAGTYMISLYQSRN